MGAQLGTANKVIIARLALTNVGAESNLEAFNEDTAEAKAVRDWYDFCRLEALDDLDWGFARTRRLLALDSEDPPQESSSNIWGYRYQYPENCVRARRLQNPWNPPTDAFPFEIELNSNEQKTILTDIQNATLVYTKNITNAGLFTPRFVTALSYLLASRIAFTLTGKSEIADANYKYWEVHKRKAEANEANELVDAPAPDADWIEEREGIISPVGAMRTTVTTYPDASN